MKFFRQAWAMIFLAAISTNGRAAETPLPTMDTILQRVIEHAGTEGEANHTFNQNYSYSRVKVTEYHSADGSLKKREKKDSVHQPNIQKAEADADDETPTSADKTDANDAKNPAVSDTHSNVHGKAFKKNDILNTNVLSRFKFTLVGSEKINDRPAFVVDFVPAKKDLPEHNLKDRFINKAAGRVWVDAQDYALVKADLRLTKPVDVAWGLVGAVWKFTYGFDRSRTPDGFWFTQDVNWHLEGREVIVNRVVDYHESLTNLQKVTSVAVR